MTVPERDTALHRLARLILEIDPALERHRLPTALTPMVEDLMDEHECSAEDALARLRILRITVDLRRSPTPATPHRIHQAYRQRLLARRRRRRR